VAHSFLLALSVLVFAAAPVSGSGDPPWQLICEDAFDRRTLGTNWLILRGDWHINAQGQLQIQRQWPSHSFLASNVPLRGKNVRVEFDFLIPADQAGKFGAYLQAGALGWGAGGVDDRVGVEVQAAGPEKSKPSNAEAPSVAVDQWHRMVLTLCDGGYEVTVDARVVASGQVAQGRSLLNSGLQFSAAPGARVDNLKIRTARMARPLPAVNGATPEENRRATVFAEKFLDRMRPDCGFQAAIDSLPPGGGAVVLPRGEFLLRRFLDMPSHTTLTGQGPETVLKVVDATWAPIESAASHNGVHTLRLKGPHDFRKGDAFAYDNSWGHPINARPPGAQGARHMLGGGSASENRLLVLDVQGDVVTVNAPPPPGKGKRIVHFFPPVCSYQSEFAAVQDLQIVGPEKNPAGAKGGFMTNPVTFGVASNPRFSRLVIRDFPADGISAQGCDDARLLDNTIQGVGQGMHPGTTTLRTMVARNYAVDNRVGLFFCWYNTHGVYFRNVLKDFAGYPDSGDVFNTLACNRLLAPVRITEGYNGCLLGNRMTELTIFGPAGKNKPHTDAVLGPGARTNALPPRYFTVAHNRIETIRLFKFAQGNVLAANTTAVGNPTPLDYRLVAEEPTDERPEKNVLGVESCALDRLPEPVGRTAPEPPPLLPEPVLDGRCFYDPQAPTCGFQKALDQLKQQGGTLRLPAGRYVLRRPLSVPSRATLAGYGAATVLLPGSDVQNLMCAGDAAGVTVRDLAIEGDWQAEPRRGPAISLVRPAGASVVAVDVRGWSGVGIACDAAIRPAAGESDSAVRLQDCRVLRCAGAGVATSGIGDLVIESCSAVACGEGFLMATCASARIVGNIAAMNQAAGYRATSCPGILLAANSANGNLRDGILLERTRGAVVAGNTCAGNNQAGQDFAGVRLGPGAESCRVVFNNCGDEQLYATQLVGIREDRAAAGNQISLNCTATLCTRRGNEQKPSLVCEGSQSRVSDNWTETIVPSNDSLESIELRRRQPAVPGAGAR